MCDVEGGSIAAGFLIDRWTLMASEALPSMVTQQQMPARKYFIRFIYKTRLSV